MGVGAPQKESISKKHFLCQKANVSHTNFVEIRQDLTTIHYARSAHLHSSLFVGKDGVRPRRWWWSQTVLEYRRVAPAAVGAA